MIKETIASGGLVLTRVASGSIKPKVKAPANRNPKAVRVPIQPFTQEYWTAPIHVICQEREIAA
jgi:hypothetical protein